MHLKTLRSRNSVPSPKTSLKVENTKKNQEKGKNLLEKGDMCNTLEPYKQCLMKINNYFKKIQDATLSFSHKHA